MLRLVLGQLRLDPLRTVLNGFTLAAVIAVILMFQGFLEGLVAQSRDAVLNRGADLIVTQAGVRNLTLARSILPQSARSEVEAIDGVSIAHPLTGIPVTCVEGMKRAALHLLVYDTGGGPARPVPQFSYRTAFLVQGDRPDAAIVNTGPEWKVLQNMGYAAIPVRGFDGGGHYAAPPGEAFDAGSHPWGWMETGFEDNAWPAAAAVGNAIWLEHGGSPLGEAASWQLTPRTIPPMDEAPVRFASVRRAEGAEVDEAFLTGQGDLVMPPATRAVLLPDQSHLTNAFAALETSGGAGSKVTLIYAEALKNA